MSDTKELVQKQEQELALLATLDTLPTGVDEEVTSELRPPFLCLVQDLSPQVTGKGGKKVEGARPGLMYNPASGTFYEELTFIPVHEKREFTEWKPRGQGGGKVASYSPRDPFITQIRATQEFAKYKNPNTGDPTKPKTQHDIIETVNLVGLIVDGDSYDPVVISLYKTKLKPFTAWRRQVAYTLVNIGGKKVNPKQLFLYRMKFRTQQEEYAEGMTWNYVITGADGGHPKDTICLDVNDPGTQMAIGLLQSIEAGQVVIEPDQPPDTAAPEEVAF